LFTKYLKASDMNLQDATPRADFLIKSLAEQGYSLESSLADLMDNSISANSNRIEVLIDMATEPFMLFLADNGDGMTKKELIKNMQFPSNSSEFSRDTSDLGRFGLGMKTASFSQTRKFTVLSKRKKDKVFNGVTWDVDILEKEGWKIKINTEKEINYLISQYRKLSETYIDIDNSFNHLKTNTIVVWYGLYKYENYLKKDKIKSSLQTELDEITVSHLSVVFHKFMEAKKNLLKIRVNNLLIDPFNPFPTHIKDFRTLQPKTGDLDKSRVRISGYVLPARAIKESNSGISEWTPVNKGLMDMEGIYVYRSNRIILYGGWNGLIKKAPRLQLARLRLDVGNSIDHLLHLNVAKSKIIIPHDLRNAFDSAIKELKTEAEREYYNRGVRKFAGQRSSSNQALFEKYASSKGSLIDINLDNPVVSSLARSLESSQLAQLKVIFKMISRRINIIRSAMKETETISISDDENYNGFLISDLIENIKTLQSQGVDNAYIIEEVLPLLGYNKSNVPIEITNLLTKSK